MIHSLEIYFDGGCRPTNPGNRYGSCDIFIDGEPVDRKSQIEFGWGTNNEAEFMALMLALDWLDKYISLEERQNYDVKIFTDSMIVVGRIKGRNKRNKSEPEQRMYALTAECVKKLIRYKSYKIEWKGRMSNVARFGH